MSLVFETFKFLLKVEFRSKRDGGVSYGRITLVFAVNFVWFLMLSLAIILSEFRGRDLMTFLLNFSFLLLSIEFLLILFTILVEFEPVVLNTGEIEFFLAVPISSTAYRVAKYMSFSFFVALLSFSLNLPPSLLLLRSVNLQTSIAYLIVSTLFALSISSVALLIMFLISRRFKIFGLKRLILPAQVIAIFTIFFVYQVISRHLASAGGVEDLFNLVNAKLSSFSVVVPQVVFSKVFLWMAGVGEVGLSIIEFFAGFMLYVFMLILPLFIFKVENLRNILLSLETVKNRANTYLFLKLPKTLRNILFKNEFEFSFYELVYIHIRRDRSIMVKVLSGFAISIAIIVYLAIFREVENPLNEPTSRANILMLTSLFFNVSIGLMALSSHRNYKASWVYNFVPSDRKFEMMSGAFKVLWYHILIPLISIFSILYLISSIEVFSVLVHILTTTILLKIFFNLAAMRVVHPPFSQPIEKIGSADKVLIQIFTFLAVMFAVLFERGFYSLILKFNWLFLFLLALSLLFVFERYTYFALKRRMRNYEG